MNYNKNIGPQGVGFAAPKYTLMPSIQETQRLASLAIPKQGEGGGCCGQGGGGG